MSFALTTRQYNDGSKDVTRRMGWEFLNPGDHFMAIEKGMGLAKGEKQVELGENVAVAVTRERLDTITQEDVVREGFPEMTPPEFVEMYCGSHKGCQPGSVVTRIEFRRV